MTSAGFPYISHSGTTEPRSCVYLEAEAFLPLGDAAEAASSNAVPCPSVPGGPARQRLELSEQELSRVRSELDQLLDRRIILRARSADRLSDSRVLTVRQLCMDWRTALQAHTQAPVRISIHGSVASRLLLGEQPILVEGSDLDIQLELDAVQSPFRGLPPGNQLYQSTEALLEVLSSHCPTSPSHRDVFSHFFLNCVAIQPQGEERDGWSLYSMEMLEADKPTAMSANYKLDLLIIWRGLQRPYLLSSDSFSILLTGPLLEELQVTSLFPDPQQALTDLQNRLLRVDQPSEVRRGLLCRFIKMLGRGHALPTGPERQELVRLLTGLAEHEPAETLASLLRFREGENEIVHLRVVWHLLQLFPRQELWQDLLIWPGADKDAWFPPRAVLRQLPEGAFKKLWSLAGRTERHEWQILATLWGLSRPTEVELSQRANGAAASGSAGKLQGFTILKEWTDASSCFDVVLRRSSLEIESWLTSLLEEGHRLVVPPEAKQMLLSTWERLIEKSTSSTKRCCALLLLLVQLEKSFVMSEGLCDARCLHAELLCEIASLCDDPRIFQVLVKRSSLSACLPRMEWACWHQYVPTTRALKWMEALSSRFAGPALWVLKRQRGLDPTGRQVAALRGPLLEASGRTEFDLQSWVELFAEQALYPELQRALGSSRNFGEALEEQILAALWRHLEQKPEGCRELVPSTCLSLLRFSVANKRPSFPEVLAAMLHRLQSCPQHLLPGLPLLGRALSIALEQVGESLSHHLILMERLLEQARGSHAYGAELRALCETSRERAWRLASGLERVELLRIWRRFSLPLPAPSLKELSLWCGQQGLWPEAAETWSALLTQEPTPDQLPWALCSVKEGFACTAPLWKRSVQQTGGSHDAWPTLTSWAEWVSGQGDFTALVATALAEAMPLAELGGADPSFLRSVVRLALMSPASKVDTALGNLADWFCGSPRFWTEDQAPDSLRMLADVRVPLQEHHRERALGRIWQKLLEHPVDEGVDHLIWPFLAAGAMHTHVPRTLKQLTPRLIPLMIGAIERLATADPTELVDQLRFREAAHTAWGSDPEMSDASLSIAVLWRGLMMPGLLALLKHWPSDLRGFQQLQLVLSNLSICTHTPEAVGAAVWIRLLRTGHQLMDKGFAVQQELLSLWGVTQPTFADPDELIQLVFDHLPSLIKQGGLALEKAASLFCRLGRPPGPWQSQWIRGFALLIRATHGNPTCAGFLLGALPLPLSPSLCSSLSTRERLEVARIVETLPLELDWAEIEGLHFLRHLLHGLPITVECVKQRLQLTQVATALMFRADAPDPKLPLAQVQAWWRICLDLLQSPEWVSQSMTVLSQVVQVSLAAGHPMRAMLEQCSSLWEGPRVPQLSAEHWAQLLLAFVTCAPRKHPDPSLLEVLRRGLDCLVACDLRDVKSDLCLEHLRRLESGIVALLQNCPTKSKSLPALEDISLRMGAALVALGYSGSLNSGLALWEAVMPACVSLRFQENRFTILSAIEQLSYQLPDDSHTTNPLILAALIQVLSAFGSAHEEGLPRVCQFMEDLMADSNPFHLSPLVLICHALPWALSQTEDLSDARLAGLERLARLLEPAWARARERLQSHPLSARIEGLVSTTLERVARFMALATPVNRLRLVPLIKAAICCMHPDDGADLKARCWHGLVAAFSSLEPAEQVAIAEALQDQASDGSVAALRLEGGAPPS